MRSAESLPAFLQAGIGGLQKSSSHPPWPFGRVALALSALELKLGAQFLDLRCLLPETRGESLDFVLLLPVGRFLPLMGKRACGRRDCSEPVQTQSRVPRPCFCLRPVNYSHGVLSPCTKRLDPD